MNSTARVPALDRFDEGYVANGKNQRRLKELYRSDSSSHEEEEQRLLISKGLKRRSLIKRTLPGSGDGTVVAEDVIPFVESLANFPLLGKVA